jgi:hypothetical protein
MNRALEDFVQQMHAAAIDNADGIEDALREIDACADDLDVALEFIDAAAWIVQQSVPVRERCRALIALAGVPGDQECDLTVVGNRIEIELGQPVLAVSPLRSVVEGMKQ